METSPSRVPADRVAVLSDIHGVLPALESVLAEPEVAGADRIVLTGDLAAGPSPARPSTCWPRSATGRCGSAGTPTASWCSSRAVR